MAESRKSADPGGSILLFGEIIWDRGNPLDLIDPAIRRKIYDSAPIATHRAWVERRLKIHVSDSAATPDYESVPVDYQ
jgi:hypothetical protein